MLFWTALIAVLLLWPAGTFYYPGAWAFIAIFAIGGFAIMVWLGKYSPRLLQERLSPPIQRDQKPWDKVFLTILMLGFMAWLPFMTWDAKRTGFDAVPAALQVTGGVGVVLYMLGAWWTFRENTFAAPVVKIQQDQRVIETGPYAVVRHPMYASALLLFFGLPLLLGSWLGLAFGALLTLGVAWRAVHEEQALRDGLPGYTDYAARVRYRFIPGVW
jgi:protein-S-isoprenylcysteine O-methyltransferase Ste14